MPSRRPRRTGRWAPWCRPRRRPAVRPGHRRRRCRRERRPDRTPRAPSSRPPSRSCRPPPRRTRPPPTPTPRPDRRHTVQAVCYGMSKQAGQGQTHRSDRAICKSETSERSKRVSLSACVAHCRRRHDDRHRSRRPHSPRRSCCCRTAACPQRHS